MSPVRAKCRFIIWLYIFTRTLIDSSGPCFLLDCSRSADTANIGVTVYVQATVHGTRDELLNKRGNMATRSDRSDARSTGEPHLPAENSARAEVELLPARMINEFAYCPRLFYLEHVAKEFQDNSDTVEGRYHHRRVDRPAGGLRVTRPETSPAASEAPDSSTPPSGSTPGFRGTSVMVSAPLLGAIAKVDLIEASDDRVIPVDYKRGRKPPVPEGAYEPERVQVCLQGLILREQGYRCDHGEIYFVESKERVRVEFDDALIRRTQELLKGARALADSGTIPPPLEDSPKCPRCSLVGICLPDETNFLSAHRSGVSSRGVRRLVAERSDARPLCLQAQGLRVGKKGEVVEVREDGKVIQSVRMLDVSQVMALGNVQISTQLINELCRRDVPISYFSYGGWFNGMTTGAGGRNVELRKRQFQASDDPAICLVLAQRFVRGKILNTRTLLRRNHKALDRDVLRELSRLSAGAGRTKSIDALLGVEGSAARLYFAHFGTMLRGSSPQDMPTFDFNGRNRRPPLDPVNCLLSFTYSMLTRDVTAVCHGVGLDPHVGFFHQIRPGRPGLALDLMEEFRPLVCDSVVLQVLRTGEIKGHDFLMRAGACSLTSAGRRTLIGAYERRMDASVTHPIFKYSVSYRRVLEIQTRLLARYLTGEIPEYPPFRTR